MKLKLHHINFCSTNVPAMDEFYRTVLDMEPEPSLKTARVVDQACAGNVAFITDGTTQVHVAEKDLRVGFRTGQMINPSSAGILRSVPTISKASRSGSKRRASPTPNYGAWAMSGREQIFFYDPDGNVIEVHQVRS